jgi:hypothetical protein
MAALSLLLLVTEGSILLRRAPTQRISEGMNDFNDNSSYGSSPLATEHHCRSAKMSSNRLDELPPELCAMVVDYLDLPSIRNLRLVSRALEHNATQDRFRSFFKFKHDDLDREGLEKFGWMTCNSELGRLLEDLTLVGIVHDTAYLTKIVEAGVRVVKSRDAGEITAPELNAVTAEDVAKAAQDLDVLERRQAAYSEFHQSGRSATFLMEALQHIAKRNRSGLQKLTISTVIYEDDTVTRHSPSEVACWDWAHEEAKRTFALAMTGILCSGIVLRSLDIFCAGSTSVGGGLPRDALTRFCGQNPRMYDFSALQRLAICISDEVLLDLPRGNRYLAGPSHRDSSTTSVLERIFAQNLYAAEALHRDPSSSSILEKLFAQDQMAGVHSSAHTFVNMLEACPSLEILIISTYRYKFPNECMNGLRNAALRRYMDYMARMKPMRLLRRVYLAGLRLKLEDLMQFVENHAATLRKFEMCCVNLDQGTLKPLLSLLAGSKISLDQIAFLDLFEGDRLVLFGPEERRKCTRIIGNWRDCNEIVRRGSDTRKRIPYRLLGEDDTEETESNVEAWRQRNMQEFGDFEGY